MKGLKEAIFPHTCDGCGEAKKTQLYPTETSVLELCKDCAKEGRIRGICQ